MDKCSVCKKEFPDAALKKMIQIDGKKAYLNLVCPSCQTIMNNNPSYYYLAEPKIEASDS